VKGTVFPKVEIFIRGRPGSLSLFRTTYFYFPKEERKVVRKRKETAGRNQLLNFILHVSFIEKFKKLFPSGQASTRPPFSWLAQCVSPEVWDLSSLSYAIFLLSLEKKKRGKERKS